MGNLANLTDEKALAVEHIIAFQINCAMLSI